MENNELKMLFNALKKCENELTSWELINLKDKKAKAIYSNVISELYKALKETTKK